MNLHGIAKGKSFEKTIEMLKNTEINVLINISLCIF